MGITSSRKTSELARLPCKLDLEGIVAKPKKAAYRADVQKSPWIKIKNPTYSQKEGREELIER